MFRPISRNFVFLPPSAVPWKSNRFPLEIVKSKWDVKRSHSRARVFFVQSETKKKRKEIKKRCRSVLLSRWRARRRWKFFLNFFLVIFGAALTIRLDTAAAQPIAGRRKKEPKKKKQTNVKPNQINSERVGSGWIFLRSRGEIKDGPRSFHPQSTFLSLSFSLYFYFPNETTEFDPIIDQVGPASKNGKKKEKK